MHLLKRWESPDGVVLKERRFKIPDAFDELKGLRLFPRKDRTTSFKDVPLPEGVSDADVGRMTRLARHIWADTNMLGYRGHGGIQPYDVEGIGELLNLGPRQAYRFVDRMIRAALLAKAKIKIGMLTETHYYVNPIYWFSGAYMSTNLYFLFRHQLAPFLPQWAVQRFSESLLQKQRAKK